jgi:hypothetical protein
MAKIDLRYHSYFSIFTTSDSAASADEYNPFDEDNHSSFAATTATSPDITYTSASGRIRFGADGTYLIVFDVPGTFSGISSMVTKFKVNGADVYTSEAVYGLPARDPRNYTFHTMISVKAGNYLEVTIASSDTDTLIAENGTSLTLLKANGDYGSLLYTADANAAGAGPAEIAIGDSDNGGTVQTTLNNVTFAAATGKFTNSNTRKFLMLSTLIAEIGTSGDVTHKLYANNSSIDDLPGRIATAVDPMEITYGFIRSLTAAQTARAGAIGAGTITVQKGTAFTIFDVTDAGTDPTALISMTVDDDSDAMTTGDKICFDDDNWGDSLSISNATGKTAAGIAYTEDAGTFVVAKAGAYFILWTFMIGTATASALRTAKVKKNGSSFYNAPFYTHTSDDPQEKTVCLIVDAVGSDSFTFEVTAPQGKFDAGTAITMFKVDDVNDLHKQATTGGGNLITDDFTINSFAIDTLSAQHDRVVQKQVPFILGTPGPLSLRGRILGTGAASNPANVSMGDKKNN